MTVLRIWSISKEMTLLILLVSLLQPQTLRSESSQEREDGSGEAQGHPSPESTEKSSKGNHNAAEQSSTGATLGSLVVSFVGVVLGAIVGIPAGLYLNRLIQHRKQRKSYKTILEFLSEDIDELLETFQTHSTIPFETQFSIEPLMGLGRWELARNQSDLLSDFMSKGLLKDVLRFYQELRFYEMILVDIKQFALSDPSAEGPNQGLRKSFAGYAKAQNQTLADLANKLKPLLSAEIKKL